MITYNPFWKMLKEKKISTYKLEHTYMMNRAMIHKLKHNESITMQTLNQLCNIFDCDIIDVIEFTKD